MKSFTILTAAFCMTAAVIQSRAAESKSTPPIIGAAQASTNIGKLVTVTGVVAQVSVKPSFVFLDFDKRYPNSPFTAIVRNSHTNEFENLAALKGKSVSVNGTVIEYKGKPEIELTNKAQLKTLGDTK
jgi:DNA/RNA endonuclease YhcR with UshA esterase domain